MKGVQIFASTEKSNHQSHLSHRERERAVLAYHLTYPVTLAKPMDGIDVKVVASKAGKKPRCLEVPGRSSKTLGPAKFVPGSSSKGVRGTTQACGYILNNQRRASESQML
jgi:hypothetical protein